MYLKTTCGTPTSSITVEGTVTMEDTEMRTLQQKSIWGLQVGIASKSVWIPRSSLLFLIISTVTFCVLVVSVGK